MADPNENIQVGARADGPLSMADKSLLDEERAMRRGKGKMLFAMIAAVVAVIGGIMFAMTLGDSEQYSNFGKHISELHEQHFDKFWGCVFQGGYEQVRNSQPRLREAVHQSARNGRSRFGVYVRDQCMKDIRDLPVSLRALIAPEEYAPQVEQMADAVTLMQSGWNDLIAYLATVEETYDEAAGADAVDQIGRGWQEYRRLHVELNQNLRSQLDAMR